MADRWWKEPMTLLTSIIAFSTVAYVLVSFLLLIATYQSIGITRSLFKEQNRPYLTTFEGKIIHDDKTGKTLLTVRTKNFGNMPARNVNITKKLLIDGITTQLHDILKELPSDRSGTILPQTDSPWDIQICCNLRSQIENGSKIELIVRTEYVGMGSEQYYINEKIYHLKTPSGELKTFTTIEDNN